jgi:hypothetical protein
LGDRQERRHIPKWPLRSEEARYGCPDRAEFDDPHEEIAGMMKAGSVLCEPHAETEDGFKVIEFRVRF